MPQYVIERDIPGAGKMTPAELEAAARKSLEVLKDLGPEIQWIHSFVTDDKIYCIYFSPDETLIREHARQVGIPVDRVSAVRSLLAGDGVSVPEEAAPAST